MFTTIADVKKLTGYDVELDLIARAQSIIEVHCGRVESDITNRRDKALLARAVGFQAAYMKEDSELIYEQVALAQVGQNDSLTTFKQGDTNSPWVAPLAVMACKKLSWFRSRSVKTGRSSSSLKGYFNRDSGINWWND